MTQPSLSEDLLARISKNLADIGAVSFEDYLNGRCPAAPQPPPSQPSQSSVSAREPVDGNAVARLHQACQRIFRNTVPLKFEFIEQSSSRHKQCILTITKPDGAQRSYATLPTFGKKNDAKSEAAKIAIDMGALEFLAIEEGEMMSGRDPTPASVRNISMVDAVASDALPIQSEVAPETFIDDIEQCCLEWRAGGVTPRWVPFFDPKSAYKQGCALSIQLSLHVARVYLSDPTFDTYSDAKSACAKAAVLEGVLNFIKHGNGQTRPTSPVPTASSTISVTPEVVATPWTLQVFYNSLPRPFPESFGTDDASEINAPGWLNTVVQNARGGKLALSFFFTSDGPPGLHGCILKLDRPGEYKAFLVDARFPKRSDAKAAACLLAMSQGISNYIRSITSAVETKITPIMRSFSSSLVYPALTLELSKINADLHPYFEYDKERDAFGASLVVKLSNLPMPDRVRRYTVPSEYRNKADAKVAVICHAAEQGVVEFIRFRGGVSPDAYVSPYLLHNYNPEASRKRKRPGSTAEDAEQGGPAKKKKKKKGKQRAESQPHGEGSHLTPAEQQPYMQPRSDQIHSVSQPGDMGLPQSVPGDGLCDASQPGVGNWGGSGAVPPAVYGHGSSHNAQMYAPWYPAMLDTRFTGNSALSSHGYGVQPLPSVYGSGSRPACTVDAPVPESGPSHTEPGVSSRSLCPSAELEPGEVVSSAESEFSESSSRNEEGEVPAEEQGADMNRGRQGNGVESVAQKSKDKGMGKEMTQDDSGAMPTASTSHVKKLIDYCATRRCGMPSFHETRRQGRFHVWIVIGNEQFDLPTTYGTAEEGRQRVARQVLARLGKEESK